MYCTLNFLNMSNSKQNLDSIDQSSPKDEGIDQTLESVTSSITSSNVVSDVAEGPNFDEIFRILSDVELHQTLPMEEGGSSGVKRRFEEIGMDCEEFNSGRRVRSTSMRNLYERNRRDRIKEKINMLKQLIPNCNKMLSLARATMFQSPFPSAGIPGMQIAPAHFSPFLPTRPWPEMLGMPFPPGFPLMLPQFQQFCLTPDYGSIPTIDTQSHQRLQENRASGSYLTQTADRDELMSDPPKLDDEPACTSPHTSGYCRSQVSFGF